MKRIRLDALSGGLDQTDVFGDAGDDENQSNNDKKEEAEPVAQSVISALMGFYDSDIDIQMLDSMLANKVFEGDFTWDVNFDPIDALATPLTDSTAAFRVDTSPDDISPVDDAPPTLFNTTTARDELRKTLTRARAYLRVIGGVAIWAVKDLARWLHAYMNARSEFERRQLGLPFGVLEAHEYTLQTEYVLGQRKRFVVRPVRDKSSKRQKTGASTRSRECRYMFFDDRVVLAKTSETDIQTAVRRCMQYYGDSWTSPGNESGPSVQVTHSVFWPLTRQAEELEHTKLNLHDADWQNAHPMLFLRSVTPKPMNLSDVDSHDLFTASSKEDARMREPRRRQHHSMQHALNFLTQLQRAQGMHRQGTMTQRQRQRRYYNRTDVLEDAQVFDEGAEVMHYERPAVVNDYTQRREEYMHRVLTVMGITQGSELYDALMNKFKSGNQSLANRSELRMVSERRVSDSMIVGEQNIYKKLFNVFYDFAGFADRDCSTLSRTIDELDAYLVERSAETVPTPEQGVAMLLTTPDDTATSSSGRRKSSRKANKKTPVKEKALEMDIEETKRRSALRVKRSQLNAWLERIHRDPEYHLARLMFKDRNQDMALLQFLDTMQQRGICDVKLLEAQARRVFGTTMIQLNEPVEPEPKKPG
jgi:hypothetical protein